MRVGLGTAPLGNLFTEVTDDDALATVEAAWDAGIRMFDTAPLYGHGLAERRLGAALASRPRAEYVLSTKVGRLLIPGTPDGADGFRVSHGEVWRFDFSADGVRRSLEESLERLGLDRIDIALIHDPDQDLDQAMAEAAPALAALRDEGTVSTIGFGMNYVEPLRKAVERCDLDVVLVAGRYTLLDQAALESGLLALCAERGVEVIAGGVFNSGVLADPNPTATYDYVRVGDEQLARARAIADVCARFGTTLPAAALQVVAAQPLISTLLIGARDVAEVVADVAMLEAPVDAALWGALGDEGLLLLP